MKAFFIFFMVCYSMVTNAQKKDIFKNKPWEEEKKRILNNPFKLQLDMKDENLPKGKEQSSDMSVLLIPSKGKYMGKNGRGSIYAMEPDNMPCLVPDKSYTSTMPIAGKRQPSDEKFPE